MSIKNLKRSVVALTVAAGISFGGYTIVKNAENYDADKEPHILTYILGMESKAEEIEQPLEEIPTKREHVVSQSELDIRLSTDSSSFLLGKLPSNAVAEKIISYGDGWALIRYNKIIGYVPSASLAKYNLDLGEVEYDFEKVNDIVRVREKTELKLATTKDSHELDKLEVGDEAIVLGKLTNKVDKEEWYLVKVNGKIGYVKKDKVLSLKSLIYKLDYNLTEIKPIKMGYLKEQTSIYDQKYELQDTKEKYQLVEIFGKRKNDYIVKIDDTIGLVPISSVQEIDENFISVDISDQRVYYYYDNELVFKGTCSTGRDGTLEEGMFQSTTREKNHELGKEHDKITTRIIWEPFNGECAMHDHPWETLSSFGDPEYMEQCEPGCVRLSNESAYFISDSTEVKDKILIKK